MHAGDRAVPSHAVPLNCSTKVVPFQPRQSCQPCTLHLGANPGPVTESCLSVSVSVVVGMAYLLPQAFSGVPGNK